MINLEIFEEAVDWKSPELQDKINMIATQSVPGFTTHQPDIEALEEVVGKFSAVKNFILIGNGGSRNPAFAWYHSLSAFCTPEKIFVFLDSQEPDLITRIRAEYPPESTLLLLVSKSGTNVDMLEPMFYFMDYPAVAVTGKDGVLWEIAKRKGWPVLEHPDVGGRFIGLTVGALIVAALSGIPIGEIITGAKEAYGDFGPNKPLAENIALKMAAYFYTLEEKGYVEIFAPYYSTKLFAFNPLLVQLIHESTGKKGKGQTVFGSLAPESQHHTNQRFFGGRKNVAGLFFSVDHQDQDELRIAVPSDLQDIGFRNGTLKNLDGLTYNAAMHFDLQGVIQDAQLNKIPLAHVRVDAVTPKSMGRFMVFLQYFTVYSAWLREQDPFDQPQVERAKEITFELIKKVKHNYVKTISAF